MKILGVYHIACMNDWVPIFDDQINTLVGSGLLSNTDNLYLSISHTKEEDLEYIKNKIKPYDNIIVGVISDIKEYEFPALNLIKEKCTDDSKIFYIHTKGVSITKDNMNFYHGSNNITHIKNCVNDWRKYMEHFIIENYESCLVILDKYDACGVNLCSNPTKHFSGNFWWSTSEYIKKLTDLKDIDKGHRWNAEFWVGSGDGNLFGVYNTSAGYTNRVNKDYLI